MGRAARVSPRLADRGPGGRRHRRGLPGAAGDGVRDDRGLASGHRPVGRVPGADRLRAARLLQIAVHGSRGHHRADDTGGHQAAGRRAPGPVRQTRQHARPDHRPDGGSGLAAAAGLLRRPAVAARAGRLSGRGGPDHDRRSAPARDRRPGPRPAVLRPGRLVRPRARPGEARRPRALPVHRGVPPAVAVLHPGGISVVGPVPARLPTVGLPTLDPGVLRELLLPAFTVLIVGFSDDVVTARSFASRDETIVANRELLALGVANAGASLVHGFPVSSSGTRTAIAITAGRKSQAYSLATAASVVAVLLVARPLLSRFPTAALAGIVIFAALHLIDVE